MHPPIDHESLNLAARILRPAKKVAILTGAGISAESGVATFRGAGGLWEGYRLEDVATPSAFARDPLLVWRFYNLRRAGLATVMPNPGHRALVELEKRFDQNFTLVTQNIDGLHQAAGAKHVLEIHGSIHRVRCSGCARISACGMEPLPELPRCGECGDLLRPDVVWFDEPLDEDTWRQASVAVGSCDCFLVIGTSAVVYPAAGLIDLARMEGAEVIEVNLERSAASTRADVVLLGPSGSILPELIKRVLGSAEC